MIQQEGLRISYQKIVDSPHPGKLVIEFPAQLGGTYTMVFTREEFSRLLEVGMEKLALADLDHKQSQQEKAQNVPSSIDPNLAAPLAQQSDTVEGGGGI